MNSIKQIAFIHGYNPTRIDSMLLRRQDRVALNLDDSSILEKKSQSNSFICWRIFRINQFFSKKYEFSISFKAINSTTFLTQIYTGSKKVEQRP